jgi:hypothetical protein
MAAFTEAVLTGGSGVPISITLDRVVWPAHDVFIRLVFSQYCHSVTTSLFKTEGLRRVTHCHGRNNLGVMRTACTYIYIQCGIRTSCSAAVLMYIHVQHSIRTSCSADSNPRPLAQEAEVCLFTSQKQFQRFQYVLLFHKLFTHILVENTCDQCLIWDSLFFGFFS